jgi:hypothetical protein
VRLEGGGGFNPRIKQVISTRALAPEKLWPTTLGPAFSPEKTHFSLRVLQKISHNRVAGTLRAVHERAYTCCDPEAKMEI